MHRSRSSGPARPGLLTNIVRHGSWRHTPLVLRSSSCVTHPAAMVKPQPESPVGGSTYGTVRGRCYMPSSLPFHGSGRNGTFVVFAVVLVLVPGPDFAVVTRNTLAGGRGRWSAVGVTSSNAVQGCAAATGSGHWSPLREPVFHAIERAGTAYLAFLAVQPLRSAIKGQYKPFDEPGQRRPSGVAMTGWRQGFLSNITHLSVNDSASSAVPMDFPRADDR
jgi:hypothetical protein